MRQAAHGRTFADYAVRPGGGGESVAERLVFALEAGVIQRPPHGQAQIVEVQRFRQVVVGARLDGRHRRLDVRIGGHDQDGNGRVVGADFFRRRNAGHAAHAHIHQHQIERLGHAALHRRLAVGERVGAVAPFVQQGGQGVSVGRIIVDDENADRAGLRHYMLLAVSAPDRGRVMVKIAPPPGRLATAMVPLWASIIPWTMARPRPVPDGLVVK